jgi:hypothetical protein
MINNRFNVVYHLLGLVKLLFYKLKNMKDTFTLVELKRIIQSLPKHTIEIKTPSHIDGNLDGEIECFEEKIFWYILLGSNWERIINSKQ